MAEIKNNSRLIERQLLESILLERKKMKDYKKFHIIGFNELMKESFTSLVVKDVDILIKNCLGKMTGQIKLNDSPFQIFINKDTIQFITKTPASDFILSTRNIIIGRTELGLCVIRVYPTAFSITVDCQNFISYSQELNDL